MSQDKASNIAQAQRYAAKGQIDKAIKEWEKVVSINPNDGNIHNTIGDLLLRKNETENAIECFFKAAGLFKDEGFALKAMALYKKILNLDPERIQAIVLLAEINAERGLIGNANENYLAAADLYIKNGSVDKAVDLYEKIMLLSPSNFLLYIRIADLYAKIGLASDAKKVYLQSAHGFLKKGDLARAERLYNKIIEVDPFDPAGFIGLSKILIDRHQFQEAMSVLDRAAVRIPDNTEVLLAKARVAFKTGQAEEALEFTQAVIQAEQYNLAAQRLMSEICLSINRPDEAWEQIRATVESMVAEELYEEALELLELVNGIQEYRSEVMRRQATIHKQIGDVERAVDILKSLGLSMIASGETDDALKILKEAQSLAPDNEEIEAKIRELTEEQQPREDVLESFPDQQSGISSEGYDVHEFQNIEPVVEAGDGNEPTGDEMLIEENLHDEGVDPVIDADQSSSPDFEEFVQMMNPPDQGEIVVESWGESTAPAADEKFDEDFAEAEFYLQQGMKDEAISVYKRLASMFPDRAEPIERLAELTQTPSTTGQPMDAAPPPEATGKKVDADSFFQDLNTIYDEPIKENHDQETAGKKIDANSFFEGLSSVSDKPQEKSADTDEELANIFDAFKKGVEDEVEESDFETHYNLGIAYKEMGLLDDAIREFKIASSVRSDSFQGSSMLAMCYAEKGLYAQAISEYRNLMDMLDEADDRYLSIKYDLASAIEKSGNAGSALEIFTGIYNADPSFGDVAARIDRLKKAMGG